MFQYWHRSVQHRLHCAEIPLQVLANTTSIQSESWKIFLDKFQGILSKFLFLPSLTNNLCFFIAQNATSWMCRSEVLLKNCYPSFRESSPDSWWPWRTKLGVHLPRTGSPSSLPRRESTVPALPSPRDLQSLPANNWFLQCTFLFQSWTSLEKTHSG